MFETLVENAARLAGAEGALIARDGDGCFGSRGAREPAPLSRRELTVSRVVGVGRAAIERRTVHILDLADLEWEQLEAQRLGGYRTVLAVPMLRQDG